MAPSVMALISCCVKYAMPLCVPYPATYDASSRSCKRTIHRVGEELNGRLHEDAPAMRGPHWPAYGARLMWASRAVMMLCPLPCADDCDGPWRSGEPLRQP